jgi:hypothetical protein
VAEGVAGDAVERVHMELLETRAGGVLHRNADTRRLFNGMPTRERRPLSVLETPEGCSTECRRADAVL